MVRHLTGGPCESLMPFPIFFFFFSFFLFFFSCLGDLLLLGQRGFDFFNFFFSFFFPLSLQAAKKQDPTFDDISVWDALHQVIQEVGWPFPDSPCLERDFFDYLVWIREEFEGIPYSEMSLLDMDEEDDYLGGNTCLRGGYKCLISSLAKGLDIRLNCCVSDIVQADSNTSSGLMVGVHQGGKGEEEGDVQVLQWYKCKYCICTAPLGVLQHGDLTFKPPLPEETLQGISHLKMGLMDKVALFYHNRFWPDDIYRFVFVSEERRGLWPWLTPCDSLDPTANCGALLAWMACDYAEDAEKKFLSDEEMVDEVMKVVRRIFPGAPKPDSFCVTRWKSEPFSRGSWTSSPVRPVGGKSAAHWSKKMGLPMWGNRLFLAGEHVVDETMNCIGTVTSAFHIGEVQARRILKDSKKGKEEGEE